MSVAQMSLIGIDIGGTKCAGGVLTPADGRIWARRWQPTAPARGAEPLLVDVAEMVQQLITEARQHGVAPAGVGLGVAELVDRRGEILSDATIPWKELAVQDRLQAIVEIPVALDADVRAAARAEATLGAGRDLHSFVFVTVGTGISACLVLDREPYAGHLGLTGTFASSRGLIPNDLGELTSGPPLEHYAAGPSLADRYAEQHPAFAGTAVEVTALAEKGDPDAVRIVESAGRALGAAMAQLVNILDPAAVIVGGGLGLNKGRYQSAWERSLREHVWSDLHRQIPTRFAELGADAGWIGAALAVRRILPERTTC